MRLEKQTNVAKLQTRINILEKEEGRAMKRINETRRKAYEMIKTKIEKDELQRKLTEVR